MKIKIAILLLIVMFFALCSNGKKRNSIETKKEDLSKTLSLEFDDPILIHDSAYILYPLISGHVEMKKRQYDFSSESRDNRFSRFSYSNLIFLNTASNDYHLLDENKLMIIEFNSIPMENSKPDEPSSKNHFNKLDKWLYYSVILDDFNGDGKLDDFDPTYLFISDKSGKNFMQVSPRHVDIKNWRLIKGTSKIIMEGKKDSNNNKKFDFEDEVVPYSFTISRDKEPQEIFSEDFKNTLKKKLR